MGQIVMTVKEISEEMGVSDNRVRGWAHWDKNPLPLRVVKDCERGAFCFKSDFERWLGQASVKMIEQAYYSKKGH